MWHKIIMNRVIYRTQNQIKIRFCNTVGGLHGVHSLEGYIISKDISNTLWWGHENYVQFQTTDIGSDQQTSRLGHYIW